MKDKFGRELQVGDICFRIGYTGGRFGRPKLNVVKIQEFTVSKVKIAERCFVDSTNLAKASVEDLERFI
jgi:hypothetical protein